MTQFFSISCKSHMHIGSGDSNYGIIDKLIQRDPSNQVPCIFSSSLKGAFREYSKHFIGENITEDIFGKDLKSKIIFHQGFLLSLPVRSNKFPFLSLTAPVVIQELINQLQLLDDKTHDALINDLGIFKSKAIAGKAVVFKTNKQNLRIEEFEESTIDNNVEYIIPDAIKSLFGYNIVLVDDENFIEACSDYKLPVIARNNLENGQSKNLWYEQIIPRESKFFFGVSEMPNQNCSDFFNEFETEKQVQIGANATIGYGNCTISKIN